MKNICCCFFTFMNTATEFNKFLGQLLSNCFCFKLKFTWNLESYKFEKPF